LGPSGVVIADDGNAYYRSERDCYAALYWWLLTNHSNPLVRRQWLESLLDGKKHITLKPKLFNKEESVVMLSLVSDGWLRNMYSNPKQGSLKEQVVL